MDSKTLERKKILVIDDEERVRLYLAEILSELRPGCDIRLAASGYEALFMCDNTSFDVLLLDVDMPGMNGFELLNELQKKDPSTPIIFVSSYKKPEYIQKAIRLDAVDYIDKPVDPFELERALEKAFRINKPRVTPPARDTKAVEQDRFCLLTEKGDLFVESDEIVFFESSKRYSVAFFADGSTLIVRENITGLSAKLPGKDFRHVSRQCIVNVKYIKFASKSNKTLTVKIQDDSVDISRVFPHVLVDLIAQHSL